MWERYSLIGVGVSLIIILIDFYLLRARKIGGRGFVFWFVIGAGLGLFSGVTPLFSFLWAFFGTEYTVSGVMAAGFLFFLSLFLYLDIRIYKLEVQLTKLTMKFSAAKYSEKQNSSSDAEKKILKNRKSNHK